MSDMDHNARYAPPRASVDDVPEPDASGQPLASRGRRFGASLVDGLVIAALMGIATLVTPWHPYDPANRSLSGFQVVNPLLGFLLFLAVQAYLLATQGQTVGKKVLGLRIVRSDGSRASLGRLVGLRYGVLAIPRLIPMLGSVVALIDVLFIFHESRRCLHDRLADTLVIRA